MDTDFNYEEDISIDEDALDVEWLQQPSLMFKYTVIEAEAQQELDEAEANYQITKAELDLAVREDPDKYDILKPTEAAIYSAVRATSKYKKAKKAVSQAQYGLNMAKAAVRALYGKKEALENLVRLHAAQYFAGPSVPRDLSKEWEQKQKTRNSNTKVKRKIKRKPKS